MKKLLIALLMLGMVGCHPHFPGKIIAIEAHSNGNCLYTVAGPGSLSSTFSAPCDFKVGDTLTVVRYGKN